MPNPGAVQCDREHDWMWTLPGARLADQRAYINNPRNNVLTMSDEPTYYVVTINMPGYLPESEPTIIIDDRPPTHVLEYIQDEVKRAAPERDAEGQPDEWDLLIDELERDRERAAEFDLSGFLYAMPDGYAIEATRYSREQLIELGYTPNEDF